MADAVQVKLRKRLETLLKLPENQVCADCKKRGPRWASANLGIFFCIECSGIHRNLGVHISFVRSVNLDSWTAKQVEFMEEWGNERANQLYEANLPTNFVRPKEGDPVRVVEKFIREKYEQKKYMSRTIPDRIVSQPAVEVAPVVEERVKKPAKSSTGITKSAAPVSTATNNNPPIAPAASLIDFMDDPVPVATTSFPTTTQAPFAPAPTVSGFDFANQTSHAPVTDPFGDFASAPPPIPSTVPTDFGNPVVPPKPQASADAILSLYGGGGMMGNNQQPQQHYGMGMHHNAMQSHQPMQPMQQYNNNRQNGLGMVNPMGGAPPVPNGFPQTTPVNYGGGMHVQGGLSNQPYPQYNHQLNQTPGMPQSGGLMMGGGYPLGGGAPPVNPFGGMPNYPPQYNNHPGNPPQFGQPPINPFMQQNNNNNAPQQQYSMPGSWPTSR
eukprot:gene5326-7392_t